MRLMMKVLYIAMALALSCVVPVHSMSMQELQNTNRFEMLHGFGESGNGDGTYIDKDSIKASNGPNGSKQIAVTQYTSWLIDCMNRCMAYNLMM